MVLHELVVLVVEVWRCVDRRTWALGVRRGQAELIRFEDPRIEHVLALRMHDSRTDRLAGMARPLVPPVKPVHGRVAPTGKARATFDDSVVHRVEERENRGTEAPREKKVRDNGNVAGAPKVQELVGIT